MRYEIEGDLLTDIADAIRSKNGESSLYTPEEMAIKIRKIKTGGDIVIRLIFGSEFLGQNWTLVNQDDLTEQYSGIVNSNLIVDVDVMHTSTTYIVTANTIEEVGGQTISRKVTTEAYYGIYPRIVRYVDIVSFNMGTDAQLGAIIDAAHAGVLDLQEDCGWKIGDIRKIRTSAFTGGGGVDHAAQDANIVISSFDDYMDCGCVMQFDYQTQLATGQRMNTTNTTSGGYEACEMCTTTLPAMANAQPEWIKTRLIPFDVIAGTGVARNNKLALRSTMEIFGSKQNSLTAEGTQIPYYKTDSNRIKKRGYSGSANRWWERSVYSSSSFCYVYTSGSANGSDASYAYGLAPFGCI